MPDVIILKGIESSFVSSWKGWDEMGTSDLYFYDVELLPNVFPAKVYEQVEKLKSEGETIDLGVWGTTSVIELLSNSGAEIIFTAKVKMVIAEEVK